MCACVCNMYQVCGRGVRAVIKSVYRSTAAVQRQSCFKLLLVAVVEVYVWLVHSSTRRLNHDNTTWNIINAFNATINTHSRIPNRLNEACSSGKAVALHIIGTPIFPLFALFYLPSTWDIKYIEYIKYINHIIKYINHIIKYVEYIKYIEYMKSTPSRRGTLYHIVSNNINSYQIISYQIISNHVIPYYVLLCLIMSYHISLYYIGSCHLLFSCVITSFINIISYISYGTRGGRHLPRTKNWFLSCRIVSYRVMSRLIKPVYILLSCTKYIISYRYLSY